MTTPLSSIPAPNLDALMGGGLAAARAKASSPDARLHAQAQNFEVAFVNSMFQHMFAGFDGEGPFGGSGAAGVWRSFLSEEYAKSFAKSGGIGLANDVYRSLLAHQETSVR